MGKTKDFFKGLKQGQKLFGEVIAMVVNSLLLTLVYIIGVGVTSIFAKIIGKDFLDKKLDSEAKSYWEDFNLGLRKKEEYYRQY